MIYWMSDRTSRILDAANIGVIGFDPERESDCASVTLELQDGTRTLWLGCVRGMPPAEIDAHFAEEILSLGLAVHDDALIAVGDELLAA